MKNNVKKYRELAGLTQDELSQKSEVSRNTISSLETGSNTNVTYDTMIKIAGALNKKVATIFLKLKHKILCKSKLRQGTEKKEERKMGAIIKYVQTIIGLLSEHKMQIAIISILICLLNISIDIAVLNKNTNKTNNDGNKRK